MKNNIEIIILNHQGKGIGYYKNKICFISNALPGELIEFKITKETEKYYEGKCLKVLTTSKERINPPCPYFNDCGGCQLQHMNYQYELLFKEQKVKEIMYKYGNIDECLIKPIIKNNKDFNYRNKITLKTKNNQVGYYQEQTNRFIPIKECLIASNDINKQLKKLKKPKNHLVLKSFNNQIALNSFKFYVSEESFFQVNEYQTINVYEKIKSFIKNKPNVLDLYCGVGSIGIYISEKCNQVLGIEINEEAINNALNNKELNNINNIDFKNIDASNCFQNLNFSPDTIIVDPPRSGLNKKVIKEMINLKPRDIIYMSCNPTTLARDLKELKRYYDIKEIITFDMFPKTYHVECLALLVRNK